MKNDELRVKNALPKPGSFGGTHALPVPAIIACQNGF
jgi:hypothetical protein